jgi:septum formation protein
LVERFTKDNKQWDVLICCDTILEFNGQVIEKPENPKHCVEMMSSLAGKWHKVFSAHELIFNIKPKPLRYSWVVEAEVLFGETPTESLEEYAKLDLPYSHSGGYELFGLSGSFV